MPKIDFYTLSQQGEEARLYFACRLVEKAVSRGHRLFIFAASQEQALALDDLLWEFNPDSFIPHAVIGVNDDMEEELPVLISHEENYAGPWDVLLNLSLQVPTCHAHFQRIAEIVSGDEAVRQACRQHWQHYRQQGYEAEAHKL